MRSLAIRVLGWSVLLGLSVPTLAAAESAEGMRARGEQLAKDGRYSEAIDAFKAAEKLEPRARHACLIALAYLRRELWPQAEIFLDACEQRATATDPIPEWHPAAKQQLAERLAAVNVAAVKISVVPAEAEAELAVSSFAPDERFAPRTLHLPPGRHVIRASAKGYIDAEQTIEISDRSPREVELELRSTASTGPTATPTPPVSSPAVTGRSKVPMIVIGSGIGIGVAGVAVHWFSYRPARRDLANATILKDYMDRTPSFERARRNTVILYGAGVVTIGVGFVLRSTVFKHRSETQATVSVAPTDGGGLLTVGWTR